MIKTLSILTLLSTFAFSNTLGIHGVKKEQGQTTDKHEYNGSAVFLSKTPFVSDADVAQVSVDPLNITLLKVKLSPKGAKKMIAHTERLKSGEGRIAILVNGKLVSVAVMQARKLGGQFSIHLPDSFTLKQVQAVLDTLNKKG